MGFINNSLKLFGINIDKQEDNLSAALTAPSDEDGSIVTAASGAGSYGIYLDIDGTATNDIILIKKYRDISLYPEIDLAIQDIINEAIPQETDSKQVELITDDLDVSDSLKEVIKEEFEFILKKLDYSDSSSDLFRRWYIDGRLVHQILVDRDNPKLGIQDLRLIDSTLIRKIKEVKKKKTAQGIDVIDGIDEYFVYNESGFSINSTTGQYNNSQGVKISSDSIVFVPSGYVDQNNKMILSYLNKAIRPANQLRMLEDATIVYFIARAPERRIFYVDVGNMPKMKAESYIKDMMNRYRNKMVYDSNTGDVKNDKKYMCLAMDTKVPLLDGRTLTISEISEEFESGKQLWAYSCDPITGKFAPGLISWAGVTRKNASVVKLTLDNGKEIICTPDHKFPVWNKGFIEAKDLIIGESMMPHYSKLEKINDKAKASKYEKIFNGEKWEFTHRLVSKWKDENRFDNEFLYSEEYSHLNKNTIHHKNINPKDNSPENLVRMNSKDHLSMHSIIGQNGGKIGGRVAYEQGKGYFNRNHPDYIKWHIDAGKIGGAKSVELGYSKVNFSHGNRVLQEKLLNPEFNMWFRNQQRLGWSEESKKILSSHAKKMGLSKLGNDFLISQYKDKNSEISLNHTKKYKTEYPEILIEVVKTCAQKCMSLVKTVDLINSDESLTKAFYDKNSVKVMKKQKDYSIINKADVGRIINLLGFSNWSSLKTAMEFRNHKIVNIEFLSEKIDTGCITIDGDEIYHNYHTFALDAGIYTKNSMLEDYWMPRQSGSKSTEISTLEGASNITGMLDNVEYFKNKLYQALNIPIGRIKPDQGFSIGRTTEISRDELKFQKYINRLRNKFSQLFYETLRVQLILKGIVNNKEWDYIKENIRFSFQSDNYFTEMKRLDIIQARAALLPQLDQYESKYVSKKYIQSQILGMTDDQIEKMNKEIEEEKPEVPAIAPISQQFGQGQDQTNQDPSMPQDDQRVNSGQMLNNKTAG